MSIEILTWSKLYRELDMEDLQEATRYLNRELTRRANAPEVPKSQMIGQLGMELPSPQSGPLTAEEMDYLKSGHKIKTIKAVRVRLGLGLKEAKEFVDAVQDELEQIAHLSDALKSGH